MKNLLFLIFLFIFTRFTSESPPSCSTKVCQDATTFIRNSIDETVNPCDNFYQYACGNWIKSNALPGSQSSISVSSVLEEKISENVLVALDNLKNDKPGEKASSNAVKYSKYIYEKCMELGKEENNSVGLKYLKNLVQNILGHDWTIGVAGNNIDDKYSYFSDYVSAYQAGISSIFKLSIQPDLKNVSSKQLVLDSAKFGLDDGQLKEMKKNAKEVAAYQELIVESGKLFCGGDNCDEEMLKKDAEDIVRFEAKLAKLKQPIEYERQPDKTYNLLTFTQLQNRTNFDFQSNILSPILRNLNLSLDIQTINIRDVNYTINAFKLLSSTKPRILSIYTGWNIAQKYLQHSSEQLRKLHFQFQKVTQGVKSLEPRNQSCVALANGQLPLALSRLFIEKHFTAQEKSDAATLIDIIQRSFSEIIKSNIWLDSATKAASLNKLQKMVKNVAFPDWLLNNTELDDFYSLNQPELTQNLLTQPNYLLSLAQFSKLQLASSIESFNKQPDFTRKWPFPPAEVNAAYEPTQNSITIPGAILKLPFFQSGRPDSLNYGGIGAVIGHELTHGFDDEGRQYDVSGNFHSWWSPEAVEQFTNRSKCFITQYSTQADQTTNLKLNGANTLGENIADNDGLREAYRAFQNLQTENSGFSQTLNGLPQFTSEQLFFLSYAHTWCSSSTVQWLKNRILTNVHAPDMYRVNVVVGNMKEFGEVFSCPVGSKMNPEKRCKLW